MKKNIFELVEELLKTEEKYVSEDGKILKANVYSDTMTMNEKLIKLLLSNEEVTKHFFVNIDSNYVFDKQGFAWFLESKEFLPDSYTMYTNKVGLSSNNTLLTKQNDVVLSFPYKDCILEGGQTKEDQKRDEIFFNEKIASNEISRMLSPKVLGNAKRYSKDGVSSNVIFDNNDNLIIKGNNLIALYTLLERYEGKIKCIYIDIPYNTGSDSFGYNDKFNHSSWLTFMKNRLEVAKRLLRKDGCIFIQCDDNEQAYLKVLCDEVFNNNFVNCIAVKMSEATGVKMSHARLRFPKLKEYILFYKMPDFKGFEEIDKYRSDEWDSENNIYLENFEQVNRDELIAIAEKDVRDDNDVVRALEILKNVKKVSLKEKIKELNIKDKDVEQWCFDNAFRIIKTCGSDSLFKLVKKIGKKYDQDIACALSSENILFYYITDYNEDTRSPRLRVIFADENLYKNPCDFWQDIKTTGAISNEGGVKLENGKKPEKILYRILKMVTKPGDIVLDFFAGSGTTGAVAHKMNRQYIMCEQLDEHINLELDRIKSVIEGDQTGISKDVNWTSGGSFVYCELIENSKPLIDEIASANEDNINELKDKIYADERIVSYITRDELAYADDLFDNLSLDEKKQILFHLVDKNKLYVNLSEINDKDFGILDEDKEFTESFYKEV